MKKSNHDKIREEWGEIVELSPIAIPQIRLLEERRKAVEEMQ